MESKTGKDKKVYIASCSFGKDSVATVLLALEHHEPLDMVIFSEVMFDKNKGISGENPEHIKFIYDIAIPEFKKRGVKVIVVRAERDYKYFFKAVIQKGPHKGQICGFPLGGMCFINRDLKVRPIKRFLKGIQGTGAEIIQYIGIAADEPVRLERLKAKKGYISLLDKYGYTEQMARDKCAAAGLLSPIYEIGTRGGCWFCMNNTIDGYIQVRKEHPEMWQELRELSLTPNLCSRGFKYGRTLQEIEKKMDDIQFLRERQLKLF